MSLQIKKYFKQTINYLSSFNFWLTTILVFCLLGLFRDAMLFKFASGLGQKEIYSLLIAMMALYGGQIILILLKDNRTWIISAIQAFFCIYVYSDFTFLPIAALLKFIITEIKPDTGYTWPYILSFALVSAQFSAELIKTYLLYVYLEPRKKKVKSPAL